MRKLAAALAGAALVVGVGLAAPAAATATPVTVAASAPVAQAGIAPVRILAVSGVYQWWNPLCWNYGYGVPGGKKGWCYDG